MWHTALVLGLLTLFGCTSATNGSHNAGHSWVVVESRKTLVYKPQKFDVSDSLPGIFVLTGTLGWGKNVPRLFDSFGLEPQADRHKFILAYPEMDPPASNWMLAEDIPYISALVARLQEDDYRMDASRTFVVGWSGGGSMAMFLQSETNLFQAVAMVSAGIPLAMHGNMASRGRRCMLVWNENDPVLGNASWATRGETAYFKQTVSALRHGVKLVPNRSRSLPTSSFVTSAQHLTYFQNEAAPELQVLKYKSRPGVHTWPRCHAVDKRDKEWEVLNEAGGPLNQSFPFDATAFIVNFFLIGDNTETSVHSCQSNFTDHFLSRFQSQHHVSKIPPSPAMLVLALVLFAGVFMSFSHRCLKYGNSYGRLPTSGLQREMAVNAENTDELPSGRTLRREGTHQEIQTLMSGLPPLVA